MIQPTTTTNAAGAKQPATVADTAETIRTFCLLALKGALYLETKGLRRRGQSALAAARAQFPQAVTARTATAALPQLVAQLREMGVVR